VVFLTFFWSDTYIQVSQDNFPYIYSDPSYRRSLAAYPALTNRCYWYDFIKYCAGQYAYWNIGDSQRHDNLLFCWTRV